MLNNFWWSSGNGDHKGVKWLSWDAMSSPKCSGGLGFKNLHGFNISLLGKHCWKFLHQPHALVSRLYKARYFTDCNLLRASKGTGSSFIWTGIHAAKETLFKGFRWIVGNGEDIVAVQDPWLRPKSNFMVENSHTYAGRNELVSSLFIPGTKQWNVELIETRFLEEDARAILAISLPQREVCDRIAWSHSRNGHYDVKSGYKFWYNQVTSNAIVPQKEGWNRLWRLAIPHKIKVFL